MDSKKMVAAVTAVNLYLEEEAAAARAMSLPAMPSLWAAAGRQQIMNNRQLVAMRLWK
jgi:hypothetical protein